MGFNRRKMEAQRAAAAGKEAAAKHARPRPKSSKTPAASSQSAMNGKPSACGVQSLLMQKQINSLGM